MHQIVCAFLPNCTNGLYKTGCLHVVVSAQVFFSDRPVIEFYRTTIGKRHSTMSLSKVGFRSRRIALITFGKDTEIGRSVLTDLQGTRDFHRCTIIDITGEIYIGRSIRCGSRIDMQRDTFAHDEFASVVIECVRSATASSAIEQSCRMIFICCNGGGPSTCIANIAVAMLNDMKVLPAGDVAAFECEHWCLHRTLLLDIGQTLIGIARWVYTPESGRAVAVAAAGPSGPLSLGYNGYLGYDAAMIVGTDGPSTLEIGLVGYNRKSVIVHRNLSWCNHFAQNARAIVAPKHLFTLRQSWFTRSTKYQIERRRMGTPC